MKNQNDLILIIVSAVLAVGCAVAFFFTKPSTVTPPAPAQVPLTPVLATSEGEGAGSRVVYADSLPGGSATGAFGGGGGMAGGPAGGPGAGGRPSLGVAGGGGGGRPTLGVADGR